MTHPESSNPMDSTDRFRIILHSPDVEEPDDFDAPARLEPDPEPAPPKLADAAPSPLSRLPARVVSSPPSAVPPPSAESDRDEPSGQTSRKLRFGPAFWTVTGTLSLIVNVVLIAVLLILYGQLSKMNLQVQQLLALKSLPLETVKGLYDNFVSMENSHIVTEIPVALEVPVQFDIQIDQQVDVTLSEATPIRGARVTLNTGGLNITDAPANIVLPAGTPLRLNLSLTVPVNRMISVSSRVPVDITLAQTDLNAPFIGLQDVIEPLYCLLDPEAVTLRGTLVCDEAKTSRVPQP
jgi:hypothetical protein